MKKKKDILIPKIVKKTKPEQEVEYTNLEKLGLKNKKLKKITKNTLIAELVLNYPQLAEELASIGFFCIGCPASSFETIYDGCLVHGLDEEETKAFINKLNQRIKEINQKKR